MTKIRKRQRQVAAARLQQTQQRAASVEAKLDVITTAAQQSAVRGARAGELEAWAAGAAAVTRELGRAMAVVHQSAKAVQMRSFAERRAEQLLERARDEAERLRLRREQQETDDRAGRKRS